MKINILSHAKFRASERGIEVSEIKKSFLNPDKVEIDKTNNKRFVAKKIYKIKNTKKEHLLLIIYETKNQDEIDIITVIDTSQIKKYF